MRIHNFLILLFSLLLFGVSCKPKQNLVKPDEAKVALPPKKTFSQAEQMTIDNLFLDAVKAFTIENYEQALSLFFEVLNLDDRHAAANYQISRIRAAQNKMLDAEIYADKASRLEPQNKFYLENLAMIYRNNRKYTQALSSFERLHKLEPRSIEYAYELANSYILVQKPLEAIRVYDTLEHYYGVSEDIAMQKYKLYASVNQSDKALKELRKLAETLPKEVRYWAIMAELSMSEKRYDEAFEAYSHILEQDPENAFIHLSLADYYRITGDSVKMDNELSLAFENPGLNIDSKITLILSYYADTDTATQRYKQAYRLLDALKSTHPDDPKTYSIYGDFLSRDEKNEEAREMYRKVITLDAGKYSVWEALLFADLSLSDTLALIDDAGKALDIFPEQPLIYYMLGTGYYLKSDYHLALQYYEQASILASSNVRLLAQIYVNLGDIYHMLDNAKKSDEYFRLALTLEPDNVGVLNNFAYYLSLRKENLDEAEKMARRATQKDPNNPTFLDTFAWVLYQQGKYKDAKAVMARAIDLIEGDEAVLFEHYGDILWKSGDEESAREYWMKAQKAGQEGVSEYLDEKIRTGKLIE